MYFKVIPRTSNGDSHGQSATAPRTPMRCRIRIILPDIGDVFAGLPAIYRNGGVFRNTNLAASGSRAPKVKGQVQDMSQVPAPVLAENGAIAHHCREKGRFGFFRRGCLEED